MVSDAVTLRDDSAADGTSFGDTISDDEECRAGTALCEDIEHLFSIVRGTVVDCKPDLPAGSFERGDDLAMPPAIAAKRGVEPEEIVYEKPFRPPGEKEGGERERATGD